MKLPLFVTVLLLGMLQALPVQALSYGLSEFEERSETTAASDIGVSRLEQTELVARRPQPQSNPRARKKRSQTESSPSTPKRRSQPTTRSRPRPTTRRVQPKRTQPVRARRPSPPKITQPVRARRPQPKTTQPVRAKRPAPSRVPSTIPTKRRPQTQPQKPAVKRTPVNRPAKIVKPNVRSPKAGLSPSRPRPKPGAVPTKIRTVPARKPATTVVTPKPTPKRAVVKKVVPKSPRVTNKATKPSVQKGRSPSVQKAVPTRSLKTRKLKSPRKTGGVNSVKRKPVVQPRTVKSVQPRVKAKTVQPRLKKQPTANQNRKPVAVKKGPIRKGQPNIKRRIKPATVKKARVIKKPLKVTPPVQKRVRVKRASGHRLRKALRRQRYQPKRYWGNRRVRSRRLTRSYRPCYYCPGVGWSYSPFCASRARRYYVYSDRYFSNNYFGNSLGSTVITRRNSGFSRNQARLETQVESAIRDYAELYGFEALNDEIQVEQEGSIIILTGEVETEEILEDLIAIARDIDGVKYVVAEDVIVRQLGDIGRLDEEVLNIETIPSEDATLSEDRWGDDLTDELPPLNLEGGFEEELNSSLPALEFIATSDDFLPYAEPILESRANSF